MTNLQEPWITILETGLKILQDKARNEGATVIIVTHNGALAPIADRVIHMHDARVQSIELNAHPQDIDSLEY